MLQGPDTQRARTSGRVAPRSDSIQPTGRASLLWVLLRVILRVPPRTWRKHAEPILSRRRVPNPTSPAVTRLLTRFSGDTPAIPHPTRERFCECPATGGEDG